MTNHFIADMKPISVRFVELFITEAVGLPFGNIFVGSGVLYQTIFGRLQVSLTV